MGMTRKLDFEEAAAFMRAANLEPLEPYPGNKAKWKCRCNLCGEIVYPSLGAVRGNGGGCRKCGLINGAKKRKKNDSDVVEFMESAGAKPLEPYPGSKKPWKCECLRCHKVITPAFGNVKNNATNPCVYCSGKKVDPLDAQKVWSEKNLEPLMDFPGANKPWKSICKKCNSHVSPRYSDVKLGQGGCKNCGYVENRKKQLGDGEAARAYFLSKGLEPLVDYPSSGKPWKSKCLKCFSVVSPTYQSVRSGSGCGVCAGKIVNPDVAVQVMLDAQLFPREPYKGNAVHWKCKCLKCGKEVSPKYSDIKQGDGGCKYCAGTYVDPFEAASLMRASFLEPLEPYEKTDKPWKCRCLRCNRIVNPRHATVQRGSGGCKYCAKVSVVAEEAVTTMRNGGLEPLEPYPGARKSWKCRCLACGMTTGAFYSTVKRGGTGCAYCAGKKVDPDEAKKVMLRAGLEPLEPYEKADKPWKCQCLTCFKVVTPAYSAIGQGQGGCVYCAGKKVDPQDAVSLFLENSLKPLEPFEGTEKKWKSECMKCGRVVYPRHHMIKTRSGGCKYCATKGMDFTLPAYIYLITHEEYSAHKVGIGGEHAKEDRMTDHIRQGWKLYKKKTFLSADDTWEVEQETLRWLREERGLGPYLSAEQMPQAGWTETVDASEIDLPSIWAKIDEISQLIQENKNATST